MNFFKSYIEKYKSKNYYKSFYYKNSFYNFDFFERYADIKSFDTQFAYNQPILFKGKIAFNVSIKEVEKYLGRPRFTSQYDHIYNYNILHYKNSINSIKIRSQLHFYNHTFFYGIQIFPYLTTHQKEEICKLLKIKYALPLNVELPLKIVDFEGNVLFVSNNIYLSIEYITGNHQLLNILQNEKVNMLKNMEEIEQRRIHNLIDSL